ncbi:MAG: S16 family serine protease [Candidatus Aenigmarchaeota archaeon]
MYRYRRPQKSRRRLKILSSLIFAMLVFSVGYYIGGINETIVIYHSETRPVNIVTYVPYDVNESYSNASFASIIIPAVDEEENGVTTVLTVQIIPGDGRVLANIDRLLFWTDTQNSIRTSSKVASNITGIDLSEYDIIYTIKTNATAVEGSSAGAALTIATIAALERKVIDPKVIITGAINHDGTIGPVGQILPKAKVAKEVGSRLFLVPLSQSQEVTYETRKYCEQIGPAQICTTERVPQKVDISEEAGIEVIEVENIQEALEYFLLED